MLRIASIGFPINDPSVSNYSASDTNTIVDEDIVIINPNDFSLLFKNKTLSQDGTYRLYSHKGPHEELKHIFRRRKEIEILLSVGKIIIVFLGTPFSAEVQENGSASYKSVSNMDFLPDGFRQMLPFLNGTGKVVNCCGKNSPFWAYAKAFPSALYYESFLNIDCNNPPKILSNRYRNKFPCRLFLENNASMAIGASLEVYNGYIFFVPFPANGFNPKKLLGVLMNSVKPYLEKSRPTVIPEWALPFKVPGENEIISKIQFIKDEIQEKEENLKQFNSELLKLQTIRELLFEGGHCLEKAVIFAMEILGFDAKNFAEGEFEHDVVLSSPEGICVMEIEGKESDIIHIDKFDQLSRVFDEYFSINDVYPSAVLVGNPYRMIPLSERKGTFSEKVKLAAKRKGFGLLTTEMIFKAVLTVLNAPQNDEIKIEMRKKIIENIGEEILL